MPLTILEMGCFTENECPFTGPFGDGESIARTFTRCEDPSRDAPQCKRPANWPSWTPAHPVATHTRPATSGSPWMKFTLEYWSFGALPIEIHVGLVASPFAVIHTPACPM